MLFIHSMQGGGSERQMSYLANELVDHAQVCLLTLDSASSRYPLDSRLNLRSLNLTSSTRGILQGLTANRARILAIRKQVRDWQPDLLISFCDTNNILALAAAAGSVPVAISERSDPRKQRLSPSWEWMRRWTYRKCAVCVVQTREVGAYLTISKLVAEEQLRVIPSAVRIPRMELDVLNAGRANAETKKFTFVGRLSREKQVDRLLRAWSLVYDSNRAWRLQIVGDGNEGSALRALAQELHLESTVEWRPWSDDVWEVLKQSHAFCLPSAYEGFPQSLLEAMAAGLTVLATDCSPAIREVVTDHETGLVLPQNFSDQQLANSLLQVMRDSELRSRMGRNAFHRAKSYDWDTIKSQWLDLLDLPKVLS